MTPRRSCAAGHLTRHERRGSICNTPSSARGHRRPRAGRRRLPPDMAVAVRVRRLHPARVRARRRQARLGVPHPFVTAAPGKCRFTRSTSAWSSGAEPMPMRRTDERSALSSAGRLWRTSAIMVGMAVSQGQRSAPSPRVRPRREARQHHDTGAAGQRDHAAHPERVHVFRSVGHQQTVLLQVPASPRRWRWSTARRRA